MCLQASLYSYYDQSMWLFVHVLDSIALGDVEGALYIYIFGMAACPVIHTLVRTKRGEEQLGVFEVACVFEPTYAWAVSSSTGFAANPEESLSSALFCSEILV